ncbi:PadR family transcriptional regulator [Candidatus Micrarchaeota archaeon]|nr:PadR family transcriptional regulator [Candidatus Micrarchaeota archaeon]
MLHVTTISRFQVLILLKQKPYYGYELIKHLENSLGKKISAGEIYPFLKSLKKAKLIEIKSSGARRKKQYVLTPEGKTQVNNLMKRLDGFMLQIITPNLTECVHCHCQLFGKVYKQKIKGKELPFCCSSCAKVYVGEK